MIRCSLMTAALLVAGCSPPSHPMVVPPPFHASRVTATVATPFFVAREGFLAAGEMQISGEPLAEAMGRDLGNYSRDHLPSDLYFDKSPLAQAPWIDLAGFASGVESYEYSKQVMNAVALELGAGTALVHGPLVDPTGAGGANATAALAALVQHYAAGSNALGRFVFPAGTFPKGDGATNPLGWPGMWPTAHVFDQIMSPDIAPVSTVALGCAISSDDDPGASGSLGCADYECDATSLHLTARPPLSEIEISPGGDGFSAWKYGLWVINYLQVMHDSTEAAVSSVAESDLGKVGTAGNQVVGAGDSGTATAAGTFLGSSDIEGFQAQMFVTEVDNRAEDWLKRLTTTDGTTLSGFASLKDALAYDYAAPLRWFPRIMLTAEAPDASGFPKPTYALGSPESHVLDLIGMAMGYAEFYALTDTANADVGGSQPVRAFFDGDPFAADNQQADGEATLHDRALAMMRVALISLDRLHTDPESGLLVDDYGSTTANTLGHETRTTTVAYAVMGLRTALRALGSHLQLYSNNTPDSALGTTPLDAAPIHYPGNDALTFSQRMTALLRAEADLLVDKLTDANGQTADAWTFGSGGGANLALGRRDSYAAAVRGLFAAYLATGDTRYRDRAVAVFGRLQTVFWDPAARLYGSQPISSGDYAVEYTPLGFALVQGALRDYFELVAMRPGNEAQALDLESKIGRLDKLVLNGWDDRNGNRVVDWPDECVRVVDGLPRGGLQMAERTLTGETGSLEDKLGPGMPRTVTSDREHDCVPEIDDARLPAMLGSAIQFQVTRQ